MLAFLNPRSLAFSPEEILRLLPRSEDVIFLKKLFVFDIDGTLLNSKNTILTSTKKALKRIHNEGHVIILASARLPKSIFNIINNIHVPIETFIALNGSLIFHNGRKFWGKSIDVTSILKIINEARERKLHLNLFSERDWYIEHESEFSINEAKLVEFSPAKVDDILDIGANKSIYKILIIGEEERINNFKDWIKENLFGLNASLSKSTYCEIVHKEVSKAIALNKIIKNIVDVNKVIVFGDGENDIELMNLSDVSVAMGNSNDYVKENADYITKSNDEDGILFAIEEYKLLGD